MNRNQYKAKLAEDIANIMAATLMDTGCQGDLLESAAEEFAQEIMDKWLWKEIDSDARAAQQRTADYSYGGTHRHPLDMD